MPQSTPQITGKDWLMVFTLGLVWGGAFMSIELALLGVTPFWLAAYRITIGAAATAAYWVWTGARLFAQPATRTDWSVLTASAVLTTALPFTALSWGQQYVTSGFAGVSMASAALIVLILAHFFLPDERMTLKRTLGFVIGFAGVVLLIGGSSLDSTGAALELPGRIACLVAASGYAISSVLLRKLPEADPIGLAAFLLIIGSLFTLPIAWAVEGAPPLPESQTALVILYLALVPTAAMSILRVQVIRRAGPVFLSTLNYMVPVWSVILGAIVLNEALPPSMLFAMVLILLGVALSQSSALAALFRRAER